MAPVLHVRGIPMVEPGAQRMLDLLDAAVPAPRRGTRLLDQALEQAGLVQLPNSTPELRTFVRRALHPILAEELGPRLADEVTGDLEAALSPALRGLATQPASPSSMRLNRVSLPPDSAPASSRAPTSIRAEGRTVLLVGRDRFSTASLARAMVGAGFKVTTAYEAEDLERAIASEAFHAILCDELAANVYASALRRAVQAHRSTLVVTGCRDAHGLELQLQDGGIDRVCGVPAGATSRDIVSTLARCTA